MADKASSMHASSSQATARQEGEVENINKRHQKKKNNTLQAMHRVLRYVMPHGNLAE
jgi:hypothetical protein